MDVPVSRFFRYWFVASLAIAVVVALFNVAVDPYLLFGSPSLPGVNALKPAAETEQRMVKVYDVLRASPHTVLLGSSRVAVGLDGRRTVWPSSVRPVYNLAIFGGNPYIAYRYLQHVMSRQPVPLVVMGLDFEYFLMTPGKPSLVDLDPRFETRFAVTREGSFNVARNRVRVGDLVRAALSLDALTDSVRTLTASMTGEGSELSDGNWNWDFMRRATDHTGALPIVTLTDAIQIRRLGGMKTDPGPINDLRSILRLCQAHGTRIILLINPTHADALEVLDLLGYWPAFENWKRELTVVAAEFQRAQGNNSVVLWDFMGYDAYSSETPSTREPMRWFWELRHYNKSLGDAIVRRIFGVGDPDFGAVLQPESIERHLAQIREQQREYRARQPADVLRVRNLYRWWCPPTKAAGPYCRPFGM